MTVNKTDIVVSEGGDIIHGGLHPPGAHIHELDLNHASIPSLSSIVTEPNQQVVMMSNGQHVVITSEAGIINGNLIQIQEYLGEDNQTYLLQSTPGKIEPEDLSFTSAEQGIDLEAGAQAIQASAATAVQNVLRSLKESDKSILNQILPPHILVDNGPTLNTTPSRAMSLSSDMVIEESSVRSDSSGLEDLPDTLTTFNTQTPRKPSRSADPSRVNIAKQFSPFGFHCTLEAPTAQWVRKDEDRCTYLNKGQFYGITLEYRPNPTEPLPGNMTEVKSMVMLVFRDAKKPEDELNAWSFWHSRQPSGKQRILDAETNHIPDDCGIVRIEDVSYNAISVYWNPSKAAFISVAIQCLSTDFSLQKGVKGLPMHLQVDTYVRNPADGEYDIVHRAYCQLKVFCDKGAERKFRQEERRASRKVAAGGQRVLDMYHQCQERSEFYSMVDLSRLPVLFTPDPESCPSPGLVTHQTGGFGSSIVSSVGGGGSVIGSSTAVKQITDVGRRKAYPPSDTRMVVYVRQENEEIYTPLHLVPPTVTGLARAIESKYNVSATAIRYLYRRNHKGIIAKLDDDLLKFYCNEDTFLMQVTAIELEGIEGQDSIMYDITLCEVVE